MGSEEREGPGQLGTVLCTQSDDRDSLLRLMETDHQVLSLLLSVPLVPVTSSHILRF